MRVRKIIKWVLLIGVCLVVVAQFVRPARTNPVSDSTQSIETQLAVDPKVSAILDRSCADCHSNNTRWPWYTNVSPFSWFVVDHVNEARRNLNFSEWGKYDKRRQARRLQQMCDLAKSGDMPLSTYTPLHPGSKLTADDVKILCDWTSSQGH